MDAVTIHKILREEIDKAGFMCPVKIEFDMDNEKLRKHFLETTSIDIEKGDELRLPLGYVVCPEMDSVVKVDHDEAHFYAYRFQYVQERLGFDDKTLRKIIMRTVKHEARHERQFHWLREHGVQKDRWYFDDDANYGKGHMEQDAIAASFGIEYDLDLYMAKYLPRWQDRVTTSLKGAGKSLLKCNKGSAVIAVQLLVLSGIGYFLKKKIL